MNANNPYAPPKTAVADVDQIDQKGMPFFAVSMTKFVVMSLLTFGLYTVYWFYRHWQTIKERDQSDIWPVPRAIFQIFFVYQLLARIREYREPSLDNHNLAVGPLTAGFIIISLMHRLPDPFWLVTMLAPLFLIPAQLWANRINAVEMPGHDPNSRFTVANYLWLLLAVAIISLAIVGMVIGDPV